MRDLLFDTEFRNLIPPLSKEEREQLTKNLIAEGNIVPIVTWKETKLLLDGHNRYDICTTNNIPLRPAHEISLPDRNTAMLWILNNQFGRRNLSAYSRSVLALRYEEILALQAKERQLATIPKEGQKGFQTASVPPTLGEHKPVTRHERETIGQVAKLAKVSHGTLDKVKVIEVKATPEQKADLVSGDKSIHEVYKQIEERPHVSQNSGENEWYTNKRLADAVRKVLGEIDLDPASTQVANEVIGSRSIFTKEQDGLQQQWKGKVFLNPPYSQPLLSEFCEKLLTELRNFNTCEAILLVNNATETQWFQSVAKQANAILFPKGRDNFWYPCKISAPLQGQAILYFGTHSDKFADAFSEYGVLLYAR